MSRNTILFDMDGVLIDSEIAMSTAAIDSLRNWGISPVREDFIPFTGMGERAFIGGVAEKYGVPYEPKMKDLAYEIYGTSRRDLIEVFPGIHEMIVELKNRGYRVAVASAADLVKVKVNLECIGFTPEDFDAVITGTDVEKKKPDPEIYLKAAEAVGVSTDDCIVVEDAISGIKAGLAAGMVCIGITSTFPAAKLIEEGACIAIEHTPELLDHVASL